MALSWKGKSGWHLTTVCLPCEFCDVYKNKGKRFNLAMVGTAGKKEDWESWDMHDWSHPSFSVCLCPPLSREGFGLEVEWYMCGRCPIAMSSLPLSGIAVQSLCSSWLPGRKAFSMQACSSWLFPPRQGMVLKAPVPLKFVILSTRGTHTCSLGLFVALDSCSAGTSSIAIRLWDLGAVVFRCLS